MQRFSGAPEPPLPVERYWGLAYLDLRLFMYVQTVNSFCHCLRFARQIQGGERVGFYCYDNQSRLVKVSVQQHLTTTKPRVSAFK